MSLWQFSESSQPVLKRCLEVSSTVDPNNKWVKNFGHLLQNRTLQNNTIDKEVVTVPSPIIISESESTEEIIEKVDVQDDAFQEILEVDPISRFDFIVAKCLRDSKLYTKLAKQLPFTSIEKLCEHIFEMENVESTFLKNFYTIFMPEFLKREHSISSIDMLLRAKKFNNEFFNNFLEIFIKDKELPSQILQQYISVLDIKSQLELMRNIVILDLSNEIFIHHLYSICLLYKNCQKTEDLQKHILLKLSNVSQQCVSDKNYGRFLFNFLQAHNNYATYLPVIEKIVNSHRSPFKKPCINALNDLKELQN